MQACSMRDTWIAVKPGIDAVRQPFDRRERARRRESGIFRQTTVRGALSACRQA